MACAVGEHTADDDEPPSSKWAIFFPPSIVFSPLPLPSSSPQARPIDTTGTGAIT